MQENKFIKAGIFAVLLTVGTILCYELWLRNRGYAISYDDDERLWADKRAEVYQSPEDAVVFIGSSRIKFDLDIPTWQQQTGTRAVQLAMVGSTPLPLLHNLAEDKNFKGRLVVDVTEILFFNDAPPFQQRPSKGLTAYAKNTPSEKVSYKFSHLLESNLVLLDKDFFSLNSYLKKLGFKDRPGVTSGDLPFPWEFDLTQADRQSKMSDRFVKDTNLQNQVRMIWASLGRAMKSPPPTGAKLDSIFERVKADVAKIKSRGGDVFFLRTPSSGPFLMGELQGYPRQKYWDRLLAETNSPGIHFTDNESLAHFQCPEFSHLSPADAIVFTKAIVPLMEAKGWKFHHSN